MNFFKKKPKEIICQPKKATLLIKLSDTHRTSYLFECNEAGKGTFELILKWFEDKDSDNVYWYQHKHGSTAFQRKYISAIEFRTESE